MPEIFYDMEIDDFLLMQKGFFNKRKDDQLQIAKAAFWPYAIGQNIGGKDAYMKKFLEDWFGEKPKALSKEELLERSNKFRDRILKANKILEEKEKIAKRIKNSN